MAKKSKKPAEPPPFEPDPLPVPQDHPAPAEAEQPAGTTPVLVRLPYNDYNDIVEWTARQNTSDAKRQAVVTKGKGAGVRVPDFIRQAVKEKLAHIARSAKKK